MTYSMRPVGPIDIKDVKAIRKCPAVTVTDGAVVFRRTVWRLHGEPALADGTRVRVEPAKPYPVATEL